VYNPIIRILLGILGLFMAYNFYINGNIPSTIMVLAAVGLIIWGYFKNGTVYLAFKQLKSENYQNAEHLLLKTKHPHLLKKSQRSYYHFTKGLIELHKQNLDISNQDLIKALNLGLRTENDTSIVTIHLAIIELERNNFLEAKDFLNRTKSLNHKTELNPEIERIEKEIYAKNHRHEV
jgi:hypothetical protein